MLTVHKSTGKRNSLVTLQLYLKKVVEIIFLCSKFSSKFLVISGMSPNPIDFFAGSADFGAKLEPCLISEMFLKRFCVFAEKKKIKSPYKK